MEPVEELDVTDETTPRYPYSAFDFPWWPRDKAKSVADFMNAYIQLDGDTNLVLKQGIISRGGLWHWLKDERFRALMRSVDRFITVQAEGVMKEIMLRGEVEKNRLTAAQWWLQANEPQKWDPGVRREKARVAAELQGSILKAELTHEKAQEILARDPLLETPDKSGYRSNEKWQDSCNEAETTKMAESLVKSSKKKGKSKETEESGE